jgi:phosphomannomutase
MCPCKIPPILKIKNLIYKNICIFTVILIYINNLIPKMALVESFSGIRGIYRKELTDDVALRYSYAYSQFLGKVDKIVIGRDTRSSGERLRLALIEGLNSDIIDVGVLPTAAIQNSVREFKADGGIIITGSHNEPEHNGLKFLDKDGAVLRPKDIQVVIDSYKKYEKMKEEEFLSKHLYKENRMEHVKNVIIKEKEALERYKKFLFKIVKKVPDISLLIDPNGGTGIVAKEIFGTKAQYVNMEKGKFNRLIEPNEDSLKYLKKKLKKDSFAAGFDCDADRVEIMLADGTLVSGNQILALIVDDVLSGLKHPEEETVVVNDATSYLVKDIARNYNAKFIEVEVGEINVVDAMIDLNSPVGGEGSNGGVILPPSRCRDGILTLLLLLNIIAKKKKSLKELVDELPEYYYIKDKLRLKKDFSKEKVKQHYLDSGYLIEETGDETGGLKAIKNNSWVWFRQSKTEDKMLRIIADSKDEKEALKLLKEGKKIV